MRAVVLAAGQGKRLGPLAVRRPKVMMPVAGRPLLAWLLDRAQDAGVTEFDIVTHYQEAEIRAYLRKNPVRGARVRFVHQKVPNGTGGAVAALRSPAREDLLLLYGDVLPTSRDLARLAAAKGAAIAAWKVADARSYGSLEVRGRRLVRIAEKSPRPPSNLINAGAYRLAPASLAQASKIRRSSRGEFEFTDAINAAVAGGSAVEVIRLESWLEAGRPWDLLTIQEQLMRDLEDERKGAVEKGVTIHGPVQIGAGTRIKAGTYIEGPVVIGRDCRIGPNAYLRASTSIGDGCHIGASVEVKNSIIMERSNVPHLSYVGDSVIGADVNLGAGTSVANLKVTPSNVRVTWEDGSKIDTGRRKFGCVVGDGTKIGINGSLNPGTIVGADCLIGLGRTLSGWIPNGSRIL